MSEKTKFELEYLIKTSSKILYNMLSTPSGLSEWFADDVNIRDDVYTFIWDGSEETAHIINKKINESIRFQWEDDVNEENSYFFEMRIQIDPLTKEVALIITDFAEEDEIEESKMLWDNQVNELKHVLGS